MNWNIRNVKPEDVSAILSVLNPIIESEAFTILDKPFTLEAERDFITNRTYAKKAKPDNMGSWTTTNIDWHTANF